MGRNWLSPVVEFAASCFDDSASRETYEHFLNQGAAQLKRALKTPAEQPDWAGEFRQALKNINHTGLEIHDPPRFSADPAFKLPGFEQSKEWFSQRGSHEIVMKGAVDRSTASHLLSLLKHTQGTDGSDLIAAVEVLLRNIELRRKRCLQLRNSGSPTDRWFELHDTAILIARAAVRFNDLRYLNAGLKLTDWALPVHRRSVPADLLTRYILAVSEVHLALEKLL
jgi:hypothetical protein